MVAAVGDPRINHPVVLELRALRAAMAESEWAFFSRAREIEQDRSRWYPIFATWDAVLDVGNLCRPARYRTWCKAVELYGEQTVREIGLDAADALVTKSPPPQAAASAIAHFKASAQTNHVPISRQQARNMIDKFDTREKTSGLVEKIEREKSAVEQLKEAKRRIAQLEKEVAELQAENAMLRERLAKSGVPLKGGNSTSRKATAKKAKSKGSSGT